MANTGQQRNEDVMSESSLALECCISKESLKDSASKLIEEINGQRQENTRMIEDFKRTQTEAVRYSFKIFCTPKRLYGTFTHVNVAIKQKQK